MLSRARRIIPSSLARPGLPGGSVSDRKMRRTAASLSSVWLGVARPGFAAGLFILLALTILGPMQPKLHAAQAIIVNTTSDDNTSGDGLCSLRKAVANADAKSAFLPQCGLAPGFVSIVAQHLASGFDDLRDVHMRVGALPIYPSNSLKYNLTWSTDGLINEYCNRCEAIIDGERVETQPLEEVDRFSLDGIDYEAFNTSGGLGTLCETLQGKVQNLNYKTVRYPGHRDIVKTLIRDLRLGSRRALLKDVLETALPITYQDVVLVFVTVSGMKQGLLTQETYAKKIYGQTVDGKRLSAIQLTTASGLCVILDLLMEGALPQRGLVKQEEIDLNVFLANRFGKYYQ